MNKKGYSLIEMLIAITILTIVTLGFFAWATTIIQINLSTQKNNTGLSIAKEITEKLNNLSENSPLLQPVINKCVGFDSTGNLKRCTSCSNGSPGQDIQHDQSGLTEFTNPWNQVNSTLYMYDKNACKERTWLDSNCKTNITINPSTNQQIDHPRSSNNAYNIINPVLYQNNTTYYAVWSVVYVSCLGETHRRKIFVTVYWIDPEPEDTSITDVQSKISTGTYTLKTTSVVTDRIIGLEK